jgi:hypothetical protein
MATAKQKHAIAGGVAAGVVVAVVVAVLVMYFLGVFKKGGGGGGGAPSSVRSGFTCDPKQQKCVFASDNGTDPAVKVYATAADCKCWTCDAATNNCRFVSSNTETGNSPTPTPTPLQRRPGYTCAPTTQTCVYHDDNGDDSLTQVFASADKCACWKCSDVSKCDFVTDAQQAGDYVNRADCSNCLYSCIA